MPIRIKICGVTRPEDARAAVDAGADAIGLNFYPRSPRYLDLARAREVGLAAEGALLVGVFVNADRETILRTSETAGLHFVQLHGDENPELLASLPLPTIKAFRLEAGRQDLRSVMEYLDRCRQLGTSPAYSLFDAFRPGVYGGSGEKADWKMLAHYCQGTCGNPPMLLAGGLTPKNVTEAILEVRPAGVDVASGVETAPGVKSPDLVRAFIAAVHAARDGG